MTGPKPAKICRLPACPLPEDALCLEECAREGRCRAGSLRMRDAGTLFGRPLGAVGETLRFLSLHPERGTVLVPFDAVEATSLYEALSACTPEDDGVARLALAETCSRRGLVDCALRELERAGAADPALHARIDASRGRICSRAVERGVEEARRHLEAGRPFHAAAALDDVTAKFSACSCVEEARALRASIQVPASPTTAAGSEDD